MSLLELTSDTPNEPLPRGELTGGVGADVVAFNHGARQEGELDSVVGVARDDVAGGGCRPAKRQAGREIRMTETEDRVRQRTVARGIGANVVAGNQTLERTASISTPVLGIARDDVAGAGDRPASVVFAELPSTFTP